jgi:arylsulfatase
VDQEVGRVFDQLRRMNAWDNTLIVFLSDNGADATIMVRGDGNDREADKGSAKSFLCIGPGWATLSNTPFRRHKIWVHEGGISTPLIVSWPARIMATADMPGGNKDAQHPVTAAPRGDHTVAAAPRGGRSERSEDTNPTHHSSLITHHFPALRHTPAHIIDFVPTVLELAGVTPPESWNDAKRPPLPGKSLVPTFDRDVEIPRDYLYWNHEGNHALRIGDWKIVAEKEGNESWALYDLKTDRIESHDLAGTHPGKLSELTARWAQLDREFRRQGR